MVLNFITFANTAYMNPSRILSEAEDFGVFDSIRHFTEHDIPEYIEKHRGFIQHMPFGYGNWIWKPKIVLDALLTMNENDILLYCDAGSKLNKKGITRFHEYVDMLKTSDKYVLVFSTNTAYVPQRFIKQDVVMNYYPEFNNRDIYKHYFCAGIFMIKKTQTSLKFMNDWLMLCENYNFLTNSPSLRFNESSDWQGNDCDAALFNICLAKHASFIMVYPDETNVYLSNGQQDYDTDDWSSLDMFPLQLRRLRPGKKNL